jgi:predicted ATP-dependent endonuclease of OLD family
MQIRNVQIQRFRGIKSLDWCVDGQIICLIGPGDSTKSTILSAIDYVSRHVGESILMILISMAATHPHRL